MLPRRPDDIDPHLPSSTVCDPQPPHRPLCDPETRFTEKFTHGPGKKKTRRKSIRDERARKEGICDKWAYTSFTFWEAYMIIIPVGIAKLIKGDIIGDVKCCP